MIAENLIAEWTEIKRGMADAAAEQKGVDYDARPKAWHDRWALLCERLYRTENSMEKYGATLANTRAA